MVRHGVKDYGSWETYRVSSGRDIVSGKRVSGALLGRLGEDLVMARGGFVFGQ